MSIATVFLSLGLMWSATDGLQVGWVSEKGPGSGFWPFWLSFGMLGASIWTLVRWILKQTPESTNMEPYLPRAAFYVVSVSIGAVFGLLILIHLIGIYIALLIFMLFYTKFVGRHGWPLSLALMIGTPVFIFCLFEWALTIPLPKSISEPLFYPIYDLMY